MRAHTISVATLTMPHLLHKTSQDLSFPVLLTIIFNVIINNYYSVDAMFKWCPSDLDVALRKLVWKESKVWKGCTDHCKYEKGVWATSKKGRKKYPVTWTESLVPEPWTFSLVCAKLVLCTVRVYFHSHFLRVEERIGVSGKGEEMPAKHAVKFKIYNSPRHLESREGSNATTSDSLCQESTKLE